MSLRPLDKHVRLVSSEYVIKPDDYANIDAIFKKAFNTEVKRALMFKDGDGVVRKCSEWALQTTFFTITSFEGIKEFFDQNLNDAPNSLAVLDFLNSLIMTFHAYCDMQNLEYRGIVFDAITGGIDSITPDIYINEGYGESAENYTSLPQHYVRSLSNYDRLLNAFSANPWFYALALIRFLGLDLVMEQSTSKAK